MAGVAGGGRRPVTARRSHRARRRAERHRRRARDPPARTAHSSVPRALEERSQTFRDSRYARARADRREAERARRANLVRGCACAGRWRQRSVDRTWRARSSTRAGRATRATRSIATSAAGRPAYVAKQRLVRCATRSRSSTRAAASPCSRTRAGAGDARSSSGSSPSGLDGVEVRHPGHSGEDTLRLGALVDSFGLVPSGGSDWHGASEGPRVLGVMRVPLTGWTGRTRASPLASRAAAHAA